MVRPGVSGAAVGICPGTLVPFGSHDPESIERSFTASARGGFDSIALWSQWAVICGLETTRTMIEELGISVRALEASVRWGQGPEDAIDEVQLHLEVADLFGVDLLQAALLSPDLDMPRAVEGFAALCEEARHHGVRVAIEFVPWLAIPDLETAWRIVDQSGADNGGICIDMLHWHRQPGGPNFGLLAQIPTDRIYYVQVCDAGAVPAVSAEAYLADALIARPVPGEGVVDIPALVNALESSGAEPYFACEVFNEDLRSQGADAMAKRLRAAASGVLARRPPEVHVDG